MTMTYRRATALLFALSLPLLGNAASLTGFQARYTVKAHGIVVGDITQTLTIKNQRYLFSSDLYSTIPFTDLNIKETTQGQWLSTGPVPEKYTYHRKNYSKTSETITQFDWQKHLATTTKSDNKHPTTRMQTTITDGTQDALSYQLELRNRLINHNTNLILKLVSKGAMKTYIFKQSQTIKIPTPLGELTTIQVQRTNSPANKSIIFWLAPKLNYGIARIIDNENVSLKLEGTVSSYHTT